MKTGIKSMTMLVCLVFLVMNLQAANDYKSKKTLNKTFSTSSGSTLLVSNEYGVINIREWDKNEVSFEVTVTATAKKQADAEQIVNTVTVNFNQTGNLISANTNYSSLKNCNCSRTVDYQIMVPRNIHYQLKNEYGNIAMENAKGNVSISLEYGNLKGLNFTGADNQIKIEYGNMAIGQLMGTNNEVKVEYGNDLSVSSSNKMGVKIEYSKMKIGTVTDLNIKSEYSDVSIQKVNNLNFQSEYENYNIGEADVMTGKASYTNFTVKQLNKSVSIPGIEYGKINIQNVNPKFENLNINGSYTPIDIKIDPSVSYNIDAVTDYNHVSFSNSNNNVKKTSKDERESAKGVVGSGSPKASVTIKTEYAPINLK